MTCTDRPRSDDDDDRSAVLAQFVRGVARGWAWAIVGFSG